MKLTTPVDIEPLEVKLTYRDSILFIGSCFADEMGRRCSERYFDAMVNPFGVLFNPCSISDCLGLLEGHGINADQCSFIPEDVIETPGGFCSFHHHGSFSRPTPQEFLDNANKALADASDFYYREGWVVVTLGTAFIYTDKESGMVVANCHKLPAERFERTMIDADQVYDALSQYVAARPNRQWIFTVSPVRHLADGKGLQNIRHGAMAVDGTDKAGQFGNGANPAAGTVQAGDEIPAIALLHGGELVVERRPWLGVGVHVVARLARETVLEVVSAQRKVPAAGRTKDFFLHELFIGHARSLFNHQRQQKVPEVGILLIAAGLEGQAPGNFLPYQKIRGRRLREPVLLHEPRRIEHDVSAARRKPALVAKQVLHGDFVEAVVPNVFVVFSEDAVRPEDRRFQEHLAFFLQPHDPYGREQFGDGGQTEAHVGMHPRGSIGPSIPPRVEEGVVAHDGERRAVQPPEIEETVNGVVHEGKLGELVGKAAAEVFLPGNGRLFRGR